MSDMADVSVAEMSVPESLRAEITSCSTELQRLQERLDGVLSSLQVPAVEISSRVKTPESIALKLEQLPGRSLGDISDLVAGRIVVLDRKALADAIGEIARRFEVDVPEYSGERVHMVIPRGSPLLEAPRTDVEIQVLTVGAAAEMLLQHWRAYKPEVRSRTAQAPEANPLISALGRTVEEFRGLIDNPEVHEKRDIHPFVEENSFLLFPNPDATLSEVPIGMGTEYRIDFMVRRPNATYLLVELESPRRRIVTADGDFTAEMNHALCQVEDWQEWIENNLTTVQRYYPEITSPEGLIVIGREDGSEAQSRRLRRRNVNMRGRIEILTYDDLLRGAESYVRSLEVSGKKLSSHSG